MNLFKKLILSVFFVTLPTFCVRILEPEELIEYGIYRTNIYDESYELDRDILASFNVIKILINPYGTISTISNIIYESHNLSSIISLAVNRQTLLMLGCYYYYQLNQDNKAQQKMLEKLQEKIESLETNKPQQATLEKLQELIDILETKDTQTQNAQDTEKQTEEDPSNAE